MNILFFLTPKADVSHLEETDTLRQVIEKMEHHGYTALPLLAKDGTYVGTITEGDILREMKEKNFPGIHQLENILMTQIKRKKDNEVVKIDESMEDLFEVVKNQNFVPVVDDNNVFIGIVTRKDVILYLQNKLNAK